MIFGIVVLHVPPFIPLAETDPSLFASIKAFFQHAVFRTSVPVLTFISGYLLYSSNLDLRFWDLAQKKTRTLLIPLVLFNIPLIIVLYFVQSHGLISHDFSEQVHPFQLTNWVDITLGLTKEPVNYPLSFLRDLFIISLFAPIFGFLLRRLPAVGLLAVFSIFWFNLDGLFVLRNTMPILFYLGGMAALLNWDMKKLDNFGIPLAIAFIAFCIVIIAFKIDNRNYLRIVSPFLIWPAASLISRTAFGHWIAGISKYSFFVFLMHAPLVFALSHLYKSFLSEIPYWFFWTLVPFITAFLLIKLYKFLRLLSPGAMHFALGGR
jgi:succinoglycan biosynthesis protein ExoH